MSAARAERKHNVMARELETYEDIVRAPPRARRADDHKPMPILHRDIKSENILLTDDLQARIADLGEARMMAEDQKMTVVGTKLYTAPEVLRGEQYGTAADVFSFSIVMCEMLTLREPYSEVRKNNGSEIILSLAQISAMTSKAGGPRPLIPSDMDTSIHNLIKECWDDDP